MFTIDCPTYRNRKNYDRNKNRRVGGIITEAADVQINDTLNAREISFSSSSENSDSPPTPPSGGWISNESPQVEQKKAETPKAVPQKPAELPSINYKLSKVNELIKAHKRGQKLKQIRIRKGSQNLQKYIQKIGSRPKQ